MSSKHPVLSQFSPRTRGRLLKLRAKHLASLKYRLGRLVLRARHGTLWPGGHAPIEGKFATFKAVDDYCHWRATYPQGEVYLGSNWPSSYPCMMWVLLGDMAAFAAATTKRATTESARLSRKGAK